MPRPITICHCPPNNATIMFNNDKAAIQMNVLADEARALFIIFEVIGDGSGFGVIINKYINLYLTLTLLHSQIQRMLNTISGNQNLYTIDPLVSDVFQGNRLHLNYHEL